MLSQADSGTPCASMAALSSGATISYQSLSWASPVRIKRRPVCELKAVGEKRTASLIVSITFSSS